MNIAYLTNQYPKVSHTFIRREIEAVEAAGHTVERISLRGTPDQLVDGADLREEAMTRVILAKPKLLLLGTACFVALTRPISFLRGLGTAWVMGLRSERGVIRNLGYLVAACTLAHWASRAGYAHVHAHFGTNPAAVAMLCRILGGPSYSFTVHGPEEFDKPWSLSLSEKIRHAEFVAGVSSFGRSQLYRHCDYAQWPKIHIVRCGVEEAFFGHQVSPVPALSELVCVGRLCEQKGQLLLLDAAAELKRSGAAFRIVLVGDGEMRDEIERRIEELGLVGTVEVTGWASGVEVRRYLERARALILPSFAEGLPVVIMEALALGRPVLSTYIAGIPELVEPRISGWLVPAGSVEALVQAMREVLDASEQHLSILGTAGRERVLDMHDVKRSVKPLLAFFNTLNSNSLMPDTVET